MFAWWSVLKLTDALFLLLLQNVWREDFHRWDFIYSVCVLRPFSVVSCEFTSQMKRFLSMTSRAKFTNYIWKCSGVSRIESFLFGGKSDAGKLWGMIWQFADLNVSLKFIIWVTPNFICKAQTSKMLLKTSLHTSHSVTHSGSVKLREPVISQCVRAFKHLKK